MFGPQQHWSLLVQGDDKQVQKSWSGVVFFSLSKIYKATMVDF